MFVQQWESGLRMVVVRHPPCLLRRVTTLAVATQRAAMAVVIFVTTNAGLWCVLEIRRLGMTGLAFGLGMPLFELEASGCMIKPRFTPATLGMAITAGRAQCALMLVIRLVAGEAGCW